MATHSMDLFAALRIVGEEFDHPNEPSKATRLLRAAPESALFPDQKITLTVAPDGWLIRIDGSGDGYVSLRIRKDGGIVVEREIHRDGEPDYRRSSI